MAIMLMMIAKMRVGVASVRPIAHTEVRRHRTPLYAQLNQIATQHL
ncbi:MAG TPA: hypothetical protein VK211_00705 [Kamptonema sp.]|nr:hypothetical protein [Kamptonema sp.]